MHYLRIILIVFYFNYNISSVAQFNSLIYVYLIYTENLIIWDCATRLHVSTKLEFLWISNKVIEMNLLLKVL